MFGPSREIAQSPHNTLQAGSCCRPRRGRSHTAKQCPPTLNTLHRMRSKSLLRRRRRRRLRRQSHVAARLETSIVGHNADLLIVRDAYAQSNTTSNEVEATKLTLDSGQEYVNIKFIKLKPPDHTSKQNRHEPNASPIRAIGEAGRQGRPAPCVPALHSACSRHCNLISVDVIKCADGICIGARARTTSASVR